MRWRKANYKTWPEIKKELPDVIRKIQLGETYWFDILQTFDNSKEYALVIGWADGFKDEWEELAMMIAYEEPDACMHEYGSDWQMPVMDKKGTVWDTETSISKEDADRTEFISNTVKWFEDQWNLMKPYLEAQMYEPKPINTSNVVLPTKLGDLTEELAESTHDNWALGRMKEGWTWGPKRDDEKKEHPCLVPYDDLPSEEQEYDRVTAIETLKAIIALGYKIERDW